MPKRARRPDPGQTMTRIARAVSDREPVEWKAEIERAPEMEAAFERLRKLQALVTVHSGNATIDSRSTKQRFDAASETVTPNTSWGPLELRESVGRGGFGHVFRAWDPMLQREVALKLWRRDRGGGRPLLEARALARVRHPNLPVVHGADEHDGWMGMWTDLVRGRTLEEEIRDEGPLSATDAAQVGVEVCRALAAVHAAGLVHRDVKTANVMREPSGHVVLLDFGLAVESTADVDASRAAGTPPSMAPEVLRGEPATSSSDLYSVGVLLYRLVTRAHPFEGRTAGEVGRQHDRREGVALHQRRPELPPAFVRVVDRTLSHSPESRHSDASSLERALMEFL